MFDGDQMIYGDMPREEYPVMRHTGQQDSQGRGIFECDILDQGDDRVVVEYDETAQRFAVRIGRELVRFDEWDRWIVVGNAFENCELL